MPKKNLGVRGRAPCLTIRNISSATTYNEKKSINYRDQAQSAFTFSFGADFPDHILEKIHERLHLPAVPLGLLDVIPLSAWLREFFALLESEEANEQIFRK